MMIQSTPRINIGKPTVIRTTATITAKTAGGNTIQKVYDLGSDGGIVTATATNGLGDSATQEATISSSGNYASGVSATQSGICTDCKKTCFQSCHGVCLGTTVPGYDNNCKVNCIGQCKATCYGGCSKECADDCSKTCTNGCKGSCTAKCNNGCDGGCVGSCYTGCGSGCSGSCSGSCYKSCSGNNYPRN